MDCRKRGVVLLLAAVGLLCAPPSRADTITEPGEGHISEGGTDWGRYPFGVSLEVDNTHRAGGQSGTSTQVSLGNLAAGSVGFAATQGHVSGPDRQSAPFNNVDSSGTVWFAMSVNPLPGGLVLPAYPVRVSLQGEASLAVGGLAVGGVIAAVQFDNGLYTAGRQTSGDPFSEGFSHVVTLWLSPGIHRGWVQAAGWGSAGCAKLDFHDPDDACIRGTASYSAVADPGFAFDQQAYDERYPEEPLSLGSLYRIEFNPNIPTGPVALVPLGPVPEPDSAALWLAGGLALAWHARRRRAARAALRPRMTLRPAAATIVAC